MKKILFFSLVAGFLSSCSIFHKKEKLNCPNDMRGKSQEEIRDKGAKGKFKVKSKF